MTDDPHLLQAQEAEGVQRDDHHCYGHGRCKLRPLPSLLGRVHQDCHRRPHCHVIP